jgi:hypothetical protein
MVEGASITPENKAYLEGKINNLIEPIVVSLMSKNPPNLVGYLYFKLISSFR